MTRKRSRIRHMLYSCTVYSNTVWRRCQGQGKCREWSQERQQLNSPFPTSPYVYVLTKIKKKTDRTEISSEGVMLGKTTIDTANHVAKFTHSIVNKYAKHKPFTNFPETLQPLPTAASTGPLPTNFISLQLTHWHNLNHPFHSPSEKRLCWTDRASSKDDDDIHDVRDRRTACRGKDWRPSRERTFLCCEGS